MNYGNCAMCGRLVAYNRVRICDSCKEKELEKVTKYLKEHGVARTEEISVELNIPKRLIVEFILEDSLDVKYLDVEEVENLLEEERRKSIVSQLNTLAKNSSKIESEKHELKSSGSKMRFLTRDRK